MHAGLLLGYFSSSEILALGFCFQDTICQTKCCSLSVKTRYLPCQQAGLWISPQNCCLLFVPPTDPPRRDQKSLLRPSVGALLLRFFPEGTHRCPQQVDHLQNPHLRWRERQELPAPLLAQISWEDVLSQTPPLLRQEDLTVRQYHLTLSYTHTKVSSSPKTCT